MPKPTKAAKKKKGAVQPSFHISESDLCSIRSDSKGNETKNVANVGSKKDAVSSDPTLQESVASSGGSSPSKEASSSSGNGEEERSSGNSGGVGEEADPRSVSKVDKPSNFVVQNLNKVEVGKSASKVDVSSSHARPGLCPVDKTQLTVVDKVTPSQQTQATNVEGKLPRISLLAENRKPEKGLKLKKKEVQPGKVFVNVDNLKHDDEWERCLVGCFVGDFPGRQAVYNLTKGWKSRHRIDFHESGWIIFKFDTAQDMEEVLYSGPYFVFGRYLILKKMPRFFRFGEEEMTSIPVWMNFPDLPVNLWEEEVLSDLCSQVGNPLYADLRTKNRGTWNYARALVEADLSKEIITEVEFELSSGEIFVQKIEYEKMPQY